MLIWKANENTTEENKRWCWLRAIEWGRLPLYVSQSLLPLMLFVISWQHAVLVVLGCNLIWRYIITYRWVSVPLASLGPLIVSSKWLICPACCVYFYSIGALSSAIVSLLWPIIVVVLPALLIRVPLLGKILLLIRPTHQIGTVELMFMKALGYSFKMMPSAEERK